MTGNATSVEGFTALVREHQTAVFRTLTRLTGAGPHVEDLAQEAFLRLYRALPEFRGDAAISTYLYRIVVNLAQDEWKRRRRERGVLASVPVDDQDLDDNGAAWLENQAGSDLLDHGRTPEQKLSDAHLQRIVEEELALLPPQERAVIVLYHQEEQTYEAISAALALPINTVRTHLHRGRKRLSDRIRLRTGEVPEAASAKASPAHLLAERRV
ncbi:RNA polymerase sigma factor [Granulicella cerasi]|uniref:RNA polymerase sigma factor n=1 Tax=Granulicella cerasi TaxID=741063 RepID=A0ABW1Z9V0_9BACT|nr:sigma-70 family RNA polymerase sigma factor [Granulicella cerasi]